MKLTFQSITNHNPPMMLSSKLIDHFVLHPILSFSLWQRIHIWYYCQVDIPYSVYSNPKLLLHDHTASSIAGQSPSQCWQQQQQAFGSHCAITPTAIKPVLRVYNIKTSNKCSAWFL